MTKRIFDLFFGITGSTIFSPLLAPVGLMMLLTLGRPILYSPRRTKASATLFIMDKFSTLTAGMRITSCHSDDNYPRLTQIERWIRKFKFNELPQFWNIAKGEMIFVALSPGITRLHQAI